MGKGSSQSTSTTNTQPPPQFENALTSALSNTQDVANTPFQQYGGNLQAPFSPDQQAAFGLIEQTPGTTAPYINAAAQYMDRSTAPLQPALQPYSDAAMQAYQNGSQSTAGAIAPWQSSAASRFNQAGQQLTPQQYSAQAIQGFESPYTQSVVNATQQQFNNQNAQQFNQLQGNAASQGALGGDRVGVAQGVMAGQQAAAQAPVIAGLENQGFAQAQQEFNQQQGVNLGAQQQSQQLQLAAGQGMAGLGNQALQSAQGDQARQLQAGQGISGLGGQALGAAQANAWLNSQAGFGMANLGNQAQSSQLQAAQALMGAGTQQQAQAQQSLNIPYQQWLAQQSYPFQMANFRNSNVEGLSATAGGSGVSTTPGPSPFSQVAGLGVGAIGMIGATGGFGQNGWLTGGGGGGASTGGGSAPADPFVANEYAKGGFIPHRAPGGIIPSFGPSPVQMEGVGGGSIPDLSAGYVPGGGDIAVHTTGGPKIQTTTGPKQESTLGALVRTGVDVVASIYGTPAAGMAADAVQRQLYKAGGGVDMGFGRAPGGNVSLMASSHAGGVSIPQLGFGGGGGGGAPPPATGGLDKYLADTKASATPPPTPAPAPKPAAPAPGISSDDLMKQLTDLGFRPNPNGLTQQQQLDRDAQMSLGAFAGNMKRGGEIRGFADGGSPDDSDLPLPPAPPSDPGFGGFPAARDAAPDAAPAPSGFDAVKRLGDLGSKIKDVPSSANPWTALAMAGFGMAAGTSPHALTNIGRGAMEGMQQYTNEDRAAKQLASKVDEARAHLSLGQAQAEQTGAYQQGELTARNKQIDQTGELTRAQMAQALALKQAEMAQSARLQGASLAQQAALAKAHLDAENQWHTQSLTPPELREFDAVSNMPPEKQAAYQKYIMAHKGIPDIFAGESVTGPPVGMPPAATTDTPAPTPGQGSDAAPSTGRNEAFLSKLAPAYQPQVKALVEGRLPMPAKPTPLQQQLIAAAGQYDPTFDASDYNKRNATAKDFSPAGQSGKNITAINTAMNHLASLQETAGQLGNGSIPAINRLKNTVADAAGSANPLSAKVVRDSVASEMRKVFAGASGGSLEELRNWEQNFPVNGSPEQMKAALNKAVELMDGRLSTLATQYSTGMGTNRSGIQLLTPEARAAYEKLTNREPTSATPRPPSYANQPAGQRPFQAPVEPTIPRVASPADAMKLPSGTHFLDPNGIMRVVP